MQIAITEQDGKLYIINIATELKAYKEDGAKALLERLVAQEKEIKEKNISLEYYL